VDAPGHVDPGHRGGCAKAECGWQQLLGFAPGLSLPRIGWFR
jgi:hypothetical protein